MNAWNPALFCHFCDPPYDLSIGFGCRIVFALRYLIGFGTMRPLRRPITRQSSGRKRAIWDHPDFLLATERQHLPLLFAVDEIEVILHRDEAGPAIPPRRRQPLPELPTRQGGGTDISRFAGPRYFM